MPRIGKEGAARKDLARAVARETGLSLEASARVLDAVMDTIRERLAAGERVMLRNFGTFVAVERAEKRYFDMRAKEWRTSPARMNVRFIPSSVLKRAVNAEAAD